MGFPPGRAVSQRVMTQEKLGDVGWERRRFCLRLFYVRGVLHPAPLPIMMMLLLMMMMVVVVVCWRSMAKKGRVARCEKREKLMHPSRGRPSRRPPCPAVCSLLPPNRTRSKHQVKASRSSATSAMKTAQRGNYGLTKRSPVCFVWVLACLARIAADRNSSSSSSRARFLGSTHAMPLSPQAGRFRFAQHASDSVVALALALVHLSCI